MTFVHKPTQLTYDLLYLSMNATILSLEMLGTQLFVHKLEGIIWQIQGIILWLKEWPLATALLFQKLSLLYLLL